MSAPTPIFPDGPIVPEDGSRLAQLARSYADLEPRVKELTEKFESVKDGIKAELAMLRPGERSVTLVHPSLDKPLRLAAKTSMRLETKKLKDLYPEIYAYCTKESTSWELRKG